MGIPSSSLIGSKRQIGGAKANRAGKAFEKLILASQSNYHEYICRLEPIRNFAKCIGFKGGKPVLVQEKSPFDLCGAFPGGRGIFLDAKSLSDDYASFPANVEEKVELHQVEALIRMEEMGCVAGFIVECKRVGDYRFVNAARVWHAKIKNERIRWDDSAWLILGPITPGGLVPLRKLTEAK